MAKNNRIIVLILALLILFVIMLLVTINANAQDDDCFIVDWNGKLYEVCPYDEQPARTPTPTSTPTATPSPTYTPTPTNTPVEPSPTPEDLRTPSPTPMPTDTPVPTDTPTPEPGCLVQNQTNSSIRVRSSVELEGYSILGVIGAGQYIRVEGIYRSDPYDWYLFWWNETRYAWTAANFYTEITDCSNLPERLVYQLGIHQLTGFQCDLALANLDRIKAWKGVSSTEECFRQLLDACTDCQFVWRTLILGDGMPGWGSGNPVTVANARYQAEKVLWHAYGLWNYRNRIWFEYVNEQSWPGDQWAVDFHLQMLRNADADGIHLAVFSEGYGNPTFGQFAAYTPVFEYILEHPGHVVSLHSYSKAVDQSGNPIDDPWLFYRWRGFWDSIADQIGHRAYLVPVVFTELGVPNTTGEYDGRGTPDCPRAWRELAAIDRIFIQSPEVYSAYIFGAGNVSTWLDFSSCLY